jgi:hypothetical protein
MGRRELPVAVERDVVRIGERFGLTFQRTLRIPDDGREYPLPPGLGRFPVFSAASLAERLPPALRTPGAVFIPMYQREALWLGFDAAPWKPNAVTVAAGRINAVSGAPWRPALTADPQDYLVCPPQPWLDGINAGDGVVRQFVAMPLGMGDTIEAALTGREEFGGIQIAVYEPRPGRFPDTAGVVETRGPMRFAAPAAVQTMGLGAGGRMRQKIYRDPHGVDTWDPDHAGHVTVHIVNGTQFRQLTGLEPPPTPVSARTYTERGLPWFDLYDEAEPHVPGSDRLRDVPSIADRERSRGERADDAPVDVPDTQIRKLDHRGG